jgi:hypothetical protein
MESSGRRRLRQDAGPEPASSEGIPEDPTHAHATVSDSSKLSAHLPVPSSRRGTGVCDAANNDSTCVSAAAVAHGDRQQQRSIARPSVTGHSRLLCSTANCCSGEHVAATRLWRHLAAGRPPQGRAAEQRVPGAHGPGRRVKLRRVRGGAAGGPPGQPAVAPGIGAQPAGGDRFLLASSCYMRALHSGFSVMTICRACLRHFQVLWRGLKE